VCGVRDFVVPPPYKKNQFSLLLGRKKVLQTGGGRL
jgi:hypothetical protein